jgi:hypothetical protein
MTGDTQFIDPKLVKPELNGDLDMVNIAPDPQGASVWFAHPHTFKPLPADKPNYRLVIGEVHP